MKKSSLIIFMLIGILGITSSLLFLFQGGGNNEVDIDDGKMDFAVDLDDENVNYKNTDVLLT
jgi:hypothetical protein